MRRLKMEDRVAASIYYTEKWIDKNLDSLANRAYIYGNYIYHRNLI